MRDPCRRFVRPLQVLGFSLSTLLSPTVLAQDNGVFTPQRLESWYASANVGSLIGKESTANLTGQDNVLTAGLNLGYRYSPNIAFEFEISWIHRDYDTPSTVASQWFGGGPVDPTVAVNTLGLVGQTKLVLPLSHVELYAGAGAGLYSSKLKASGTLQSNIPAPFFSGRASNWERDTNVGFHFCAGFVLYLNDKFSLGAEYRRLSLEADFGNITTSTAQLGGNFYLLTLRLPLRALWL